MARTIMIHGATTPDLANYARDDDDLVSRDEPDKTNINPTPCPLVENTPTLEMVVWSDTVQFPNHEDVTLISPSTPCPSRARNATEDTIGDPFSSPAITVTPIPEEKISVERAQLLEDGIATLAINGSEAWPTSDRLQSADIPITSLESAAPSTVRDLFNATPRPTPSPEPESMSSLGNSIDASGKEACSSAMITRYADCGGYVPSLEELDPGYDFLPYNVEAELLPQGPYANRDYQKAVKAGKDLAEKVVDHLRICTTASQASTQLYNIQKRAEELQRFDSPASRTIGLIGDCGAGEF